MSWTDWACLGVFIAGFLLFLYGANLYNAIVGYTGLYMWIGAIIIYLLTYVYKALTEKSAIQKP
jgi:hypothetical protein